LVIGISVAIGKEQGLQWWSDGVLECWKRTRTGVMEWWSIGIEITKNVCKKIFNAISGVLSFGFSITPTLQYSSTPGIINHHL
jgi:hypothetical protein